MQAENQDYEKVLKEINANEPDVLALIEITLEWAEELEPLHDSYPHRMTIAQPGHFGMAVFSKFPFIDTNIVSFTHKGARSIVAEIELAQRKTQIIVTHPPPPTNWFAFSRRNQVMMAIGNRVRNYNGASIVVGDLNTSSFSFAFKRLLKNASLNDTRKGFGLQSTWPTWGCVFNISIDHCLVTDEFITLDRKVGNHIGSDHLPVIVELEAAKN